MILTQKFARFDKAIIILYHPKPYDMNLTAVEREAKNYFSYHFVSIKKFKIFYYIGFSPLILLILARLYFIRVYFFPDSPNISKIRFLKKFIVANTPI